MLSEFSEVSSCFPWSFFLLCRWGFLFLSPHSVGEFHLLLNDGGAHPLWDLWYQAKPQQEEGRRLEYLPGKEERSLWLMNPGLLGWYFFVTFHFFGILLAAWDLTPFSLPFFPSFSQANRYSTVFWKEPGSLTLNIWQILESQAKRREMLSGEVVFL